MRRENSHRWRRLALLPLAAAVLGVVVFASVSRGANDKASTCTGRTAGGTLRHGWKLPRRGANFRAYSDLGWATGRTFVHSVVYSIVIQAYQGLESTQRDHEFIYGETGFAAGGPFKPHRSHQNGLSVDFMVPVRDPSGVARQISTAPTNKFGYSLEFDDEGRLGELQIDFEAIGAHLAELKRAARAQGVSIANVIFDAKLRTRLKGTRAWPEIEHLPFMTKPPWIRHDEHYHVDFKIPCK